MKKVLSAVLAILLIVTALASFASCGKKKSNFKIAVPNDTTNEARALQLLEAQGLITLKQGVDNPTARDIDENPYGIEIVETEAAQIPNQLKDVDYAVINSNYAISAGLTPFVTEGTDISYPNIIAVQSKFETSDRTKALVAAVNSKAVQDYINDTYKGAIVCDLKNVNEDGFDASVDYESLSGKTIKVAASPTPHADILKKAKTILAQKNITLEIVVLTDYVTPNEVLEKGDVDANYFQHVPYMNDFNEKHGTHIVSVLEVHHEPMGIYTSSSNPQNLDAIINSNK